MVYCLPQQQLQKTQPDARKKTQTFIDRVMGRLKSRKLNWKRKTVIWFIWTKLSYLEKNHCSIINQIRYFNWWFWSLQEYSLLVAQNDPKWQSRHSIRDVESGSTKRDFVNSFPHKNIVIVYRHIQTHSPQNGLVYHLLQ